MNDVSVEKLTKQPVPAADSIDLWWLPYAASGEANPLHLNALSPAELARAARYKVEQVQRAFIYFRWAMRACLASYAGISPQEVPLGVGEFGKPFWVHAVNGVRLEFNLSHNSTCGLLAVSNAGEVGVDIECIEPHVNYALLTREVLSSAEYNEFDTLPPSLQPEFLLQAWTCKEAFLKAQAIGLALPLRDVTINRGTHGACVVECAGVVKDEFPWRLKSWSPHVGTFAAVAYRGTKRRINEKSIAVKS